MTNYQDSEDAANRLFEVKDSADFEDTATRMFEERVTDFNGWFLESFTEAEDSVLASLAALLLQHRDKPMDRQHDLELRIGKKVAEMVSMACEPWDVEVKEALDNERY
jgi:hypothetical protein